MGHRLCHCRSSRASWEFGKGPKDRRIKDEMAKKDGESFLCIGRMPAFWAEDHWYRKSPGGQGMGYLESVRGVQCVQKERREFPSVWSDCPTHRGRSTSTVPEL